MDVVLAMRPFHFVSCARNFVAIAERVGSPRLKVQWSPADCLVSNERDLAAGYQLLRPYLHGLHCKDVTTGAGPLGDLAWSYWWCPLGQGEVGWAKLLRMLSREHQGTLYPPPPTVSTPTFGTFATDLPRVLYSACVCGWRHCVLH